MRWEVNGRGRDVAFRKVFLNLKDGPKKGPVVLPVSE